MFEAIFEKLEQLKQTGPRPTSESTTDLSTQEDSGDEAENLMETDDEEEDNLRQKRIMLSLMMRWKSKILFSFLDQEREDQSDDDQQYVDDKPEVNNSEPKKEKDHPSKKLKDRLEKYLKELPVLGFNSGK